MWKNLLYEIPAFLLKSAREVVSEHENEAVYDETVISIEKATLAMCEAKVQDDTIIAMLQKYWDLRLTEAKEFLSGAKKHLSQK